MKKITSYFKFIFSILFVLLFTMTGCKKSTTPNNNNTNTFTDSRDGNVYHTITIGTQVWMLENLRYLPSVIGPTTVSYTTPYYYVYDYDGTSISAAKSSVNYTTYGVLYNWEAAKTAPPSGWHLPTDDEWTQLINFLGGETIAGSKLKEAGTTHWLSPNAGATNESGFTALPGGFTEDMFGSFTLINDSGAWWTSTQYFSTDLAWVRNIASYSNEALHGYFYKSIGCSVRCIKD
jgi:uncharacterized protein (TIGR02145 family)